MEGIIQEQLSLAEMTRHEVDQYAGYSDQSTLYSVLDDTHQIYAVVDVPHWPRTYRAEIVVLARVAGEYVVIEEDVTDKPLVDALMINANIPRKNIVLAYAGEETPA
jgi:XisI protein